MSELGALTASTWNMRLVGHSDVNGAGNLGEGMALHVTDAGRYLLYVAHVGPPLAYSVIDVTNPAQLISIYHRELPHQKMRANSLVLFDNTLLLANQVSVPGTSPAGLEILDVSDDLRPTTLSYFDCSGGDSRGTHLVTCMDKRHAYLATGMPDFRPRTPSDDQFLVVLDLLDPTSPVEVARWWYPGQSQNDTEVLERVASPRPIGVRLHHALSYPERPERAYLGYIDGGAVILDMTEVSDPRVLTVLRYDPPSTGFTHTVMPLHARELLVLVDESTEEDGSDWPRQGYLASMANDRDPEILAPFPAPRGLRDLQAEGGRIGTHNVHENEPFTGLARLQNSVVASWFSGGVRIYDIRTPESPSEIAYFVPTAPLGQRGARINDVLVDDRGIIYAADRGAGGLYALETSPAITVD